MTSPIVTICVGEEQRLFAAHENVISASPYFAAICRGQFLESAARRINLPEEIPEIFSSILEYFYKGDYYPRLIQNKRRNTWQLEDGADNNGGGESTVYHTSSGQALLKDTLLYCTAERYGLHELKKIALRKQALQSGMQCNTILASARYAYANTPDTDSNLRAHYLALIIRSRSTFKRSGTMQMEMEAGGKMYALPNFLPFSGHIGISVILKLAYFLRPGSSIYSLPCVITWMTSLPSNHLVRFIHLKLLPSFYVFLAPSLLVHLKYEPVSTETC